MKKYKVLSSHKAFSKDIWHRDYIEANTLLEAHDKACEKYPNDEVVIVVEKEYWKEMKQSFDNYVETSDETYAERFKDILDNHAY